MTETYTSGVATLNELASALQKKASSDLEQINSTISLQATAVEDV
jgi:kinesin family protein 11